jgi:iron complex outermembrane receptor protein
VETTVNHFEQLRWRRQLADEEELSVQFYYNYHRTSDTYRATGINFNEDLHSERIDLEMQHTRRLNDAWRVVWGAEARRDRLGGQGWFGTASLIDRDLYRLFGNAEWRLTPAWILNGGLMYEYNELTGADVSPRLALNHHLSREHTLRVSASRAYRTPSLIEDQASTILRADDGTILPGGRFVLTTTDLRPEQITAYEIGYLGEFPELRLFTDLKIYREEIRDLIAFPRDDTSVPGDAFLTFRNDGEADINGAEVQFTLRPGARTRIVYAQAYAHQRGRVLILVAPATYEPSSASTPVHTRSLLVQHDLWRDLRASVGYYKTSAMRWFGGDAQPDTNTLDARLAWRLRFRDARGEVAAVGQHLTGDYFEYDDRAVLDKRFFVTLSLELR